MSGGAPAGSYRRRGSARRILLATVAMLVVVGGAPAFDSRPALVVEGRLFEVRDGHLVEIPSTTGYCASCHDGTVGSLKVATTSEWAASTSRTASPGHDHRVDVPYPERNPEFVPRADLDARIALDGGRVSCRSCHAEGGGPRSLAVPIEGSALCLSCHRK